MMYRSRYPLTWDDLANEAKQRAGWRCEVCLVPHGAIVRSPRTGNPYVVYLQAAHVNHDQENDYPVLKAVCPRCHARYYRRPRVVVPVLARLCPRRRALRRAWNAQRAHKNASPASVVAERARTEAPTLSKSQLRSAPSHWSRAVQFGWQLQDER